MFEVVGSTDKTLDILDTDDNVIEEHDFKSIFKYLRMGVKIQGVYLDENKLCDEFGEVLYRASASNLSNRLAQKRKNDEYYTQYDDIAAKMSFCPKDTFKNKVIYMPADIAFNNGSYTKSQFIQYFQDNADKLQFERLIATCLDSIAKVEDQADDEVKNCYIFERILTSEGYKYIERYEHCDSDANYQSGDFRSDFCTNLLYKADLIITNPPFSVFRPFFDWLIKSGKDFLIIGNFAALAYKTIFPYFRDDKINCNTGRNTCGMWFITPDSDKTTKIAAVWITTLKLNIEEYTYNLVEHYTPEKYPKYDDIDAIEVGSYNNIPKDYYGMMGVPISYGYRVNRKQFQLLSTARPTLDGKVLYERYLIRRR